MGFHRTSTVSDHSVRNQNSAYLLIFADFWFRAIASIDGWQNDINARRILNLIARYIFFEPQGREIIHRCLRDQYKRIVSQLEQQQQGFMGGLSAFFYGTPVVNMSGVTEGE